MCAGERFYLQKDFNRQLGLTIVLVSAGIVFLVMLLIDHRLGILLLLGVALVDWIVYRLLSTVTVCYLCHSIYRGLPIDPAHGGFDLEVEEEHKKRRRRWAEEQRS